MTEFDLERLFDLPRHALCAIDGACRRREVAEDGETILDRWDDEGSSCLFFRRTGRGDRIVVRSPPGYRLVKAAAGGWIFQSAGQPLYWWPELPKLRRLDGDGHILAEMDAPLSTLELAPEGLAVGVETPQGWTLDFLVWRLARADSMLAELAEIPPSESRPRFLWGSHGQYRYPADVYLHLIHGWVYENRYGWPHRWRICSENDAHALYVTLCGLEKATGKRIYRLLKTQLVLSVIARQGSDGGWRHGEWTDGMESHYRLHCSGMHLLLDALSETADKAIQESLTKAAEFIAKQSDSPDVGVWFLHDELEHSVEKLRQGPFKWISSRALGKSESNMLVLNTQLDTIVALDRYRDLTGDTRFQPAVEKAKDAVVAVLRRKPAEWLYRPVFRAIRLTFLPASEAQSLPVHLKVLKRLGWKYLIPLLPWIKSKFPRLVMPGGYIDRELTLKTWAHDYQAINLMDLLRFQRRFPQDGLTAIIGQGMNFVQTSGIRGRWEELNNKRYALGFWAEALYHACTQSEEMTYRAWLAEALLALERLNSGVPPSVLGANAEVVAPNRQMPCPGALDGRLLVANLSTPQRIEFLIANPSAAPLDCTLTFPPEFDLAVKPAWQDSNGHPVPESFLQVPAKGWVRGVAARD
ncbi:hypothetical protein ACWJKU_06470 [Methylocaldum sp. MU1018]